ncbi:DNA invertase [Streptomyces phage Nanodon]|uniref:Serine integrase n=1 Tax=Streptomyces phage Nanodon TaxID=1873777 RepID=A0A1B1PA72_9CAUD|nr:DNA invertase [Streptomyces phage Nanodon]ANT41055.1 serine integrase [Streptomyces phage Nanodon]
MREVAEAGTLLSVTTSVLEQLRQQKAGKVELSNAQVEAALPIVGSYGRISDAYEDAETGVTESGVKRQLKVNGLISQARGWQLHDRVYVDNHLSAYKSHVVRDAFEDLLEDLASGVVDGIICYNLDRLARQVKDLERVIAIYDAGRKAGRQMYFATNEGSIDLSSDDGITLARIMVAFANKASRDTARRVALKHQEIRDEGRNVGGGRPFGWDWKFEGNREHVLNPVESAAIREAAEGLIAGTQTFRGVVRDWTERGFTTPRGRHWTPQAVKGVMRSPRLAGWLVHKGQIAVHSRTGGLVRAQAPAILTDEEYEALLVATETTRSRYTAASGRNKYLLSGIVRCAECGARLVGNRRTDKHFYYACRVGGGLNREGGAACGKVTASGFELDLMVEELILPVVIEHTGDAVLNAKKPHQEDLMGLTEERTSWVKRLDEGAAPDVVLPRISKIDQKIEELRHRQAEWLREQRGAAASVGVTEETWPHLSIEEKRNHVSRYIEAIYVSRATRRGNTFDRSRVSSPVWRTTAGRGEPQLSAVQ